MRLRTLSAWALAAALGMGGCALSGCAAPQSESESADQGSSAAVQEPQALVIGSSEDSAFAIELTNETGSAVKAIAYSETGTQEFVEMLIGAADEWADGEKAVLYIPSFEDDAASSSAAASDERDDVLLRSQIDVQFTTTDDVLYVMHGIAPEGITAATLRIDDASGLAYLVYTGASGEEESTLPTEIAYQEQVRLQEEAAAAAEAAAQAEAAAAAQAAAQQSTGGGTGASGGSAKSSPSYSAPSGGSQGGGSTSAPSQSEDQCVEGGVAFRD